MLKERYIHITVHDTEGNSQLDVEFHKHGLHLEQWGGKFGHFAFWFNELGEFTQWLYIDDNVRDEMESYGWWILTPNLGSPCIFSRSPDKWKKICAAEGVK